MNNILIVDTNPEDFENVYSIFRDNKCDFHINKINSGKQCLGLVANDNSIEAIIINERLPDTPCFNLIQEIRKDSDIPIIVLSADKKIETLIQALQVGANDFVVYPFNKNIFFARLKALIRRSKWDTAR